MTRRPATLAIGMHGAAHCAMQPAMTAAETCLTIDLDALAANYATLRKEAAGAETAAVVKADGYGLGAAQVARRLHAEGCRSFFVARLSEGEALRRALGERDAVIRVLDGVLPGQEDRTIISDLTPVLSTPQHVETWRRTGRLMTLHVETGMNRIALSGEDLSALAAANAPVDLVMSHLGCAADPHDPRNGRQLERFQPLRALFPKARASLSASAGVYLGGGYRFDMVRPGISLYGGGPRDVPDSRFRAVAIMDAPILQIRDVAAGEAIGYGAMFAAKHAMRVAVVGAGYADGVLRTSHASGAGWIGGVRAPFLVVSMDMIVIDIGDCPDAQAGERVELLGPSAQLDDLAVAAGSVAHEILTRISPRAARTYKGEVA